MRALARLPRHAGPLLARGASWRRSSASRVRPSAETADAIYDQLAERLAEDAYRPRALYERFRIAVLATTDDPVRRPRGARRARGRPDLVGPGDPDLPAGPLPRAGAARLGRGRGAAGRGRRASTPASTRATCARSSSAAGTSSRTARRRPTTATRTCAPTRSSPPRPRASTARRWPARRRADEAVAFRRHMLLEMARMSCEDGLVMTLHPGVRRGHHRPDVERVRGRHRARHPDPGRVHRRAAPAAGALRHAPGLPPGRVHARRDRVVARARAAGRVLPVAVRRRAVVVPRRAGGDPALPRAR